MIAEQLDLLVVLGVVATIVAFVRFRPAMFLFAANQTMTVRSLSLSARFGPPESMRYLPTYVYRNETHQIAVYIFTISTLMLFLFLSLPVQRKGQAENAKSLTRLPLWLLVVLGIYYLIVFASVRSITSTAYASADQVRFFAPTGGIQAFANALVLYELYRRVALGEIKPRTAVLILVGIMTVTDYTKGQTGMATGFVLTGAMLFYGVDRGGVRRLIPVGAIFLVLALGALVIRVARRDVASQGTAAFSAALDDVLNVEGQRSQRSEGIEARSSGTEYAAHVLECITLFESGNTREWRSVYNPIIYTFQPAALVDAFGWERPREAAWELRDHFITNGGISVFGEAYWNGGYLCVIVVLAGILLAAYTCERKYASSRSWAILCVNFVPLLTQGIGYGISYEVRGFVNGLLMILAFAVMRMIAQQRQGLRDVAWNAAAPSETVSMRPAPGADAT